YGYDVSGSRCYQKSMDAGERWVLFDVMGKPLYRWDAKNNRFHTTYDGMHRPIEQAVLPVTGSIIVFEKLEYGINKIQNQNGKLIKHHDGSGLLEQVLFDLKGNVEETQRTFTDVYNAVINWVTPAAAPMQNTPFITPYKFDAPNPKIKTVPPDNSVYKPQ